MIFEESSTVTHNPLVLISPAMGIGSRYYRPLAEAFAARGWQARALTRRGFEPDGVRASRTQDWSYDDEIGDMAVAVREARAELPERPVILLGHSLGAQIAAGHQLTRVPADGMVTVGGCLPYHRHYPLGGPHLVLMGGVIVPVLTGLFGYLPKPAFGGPGARTLMREWGRMAVTGRTPYPAEAPIASPALLIALDGDRLAPAPAVERFGERLFAPEGVTNWVYRNEDVPEGASNDHIYWVKSPEPVVRRIAEWWSAARSPMSGHERPNTDSLT
ncbi:alpha/beta fold hydrolase [Actinoplanes sp. NPDC023714]|uniref:alpha/beta fold hydrolase n=1 Tax=Actinoplanes sp. NPDC023714 TaxID=3154322 RepID=UPI0033CCCA25